MRILALDPAESTGYALVNLNNGHADIYEYGFIEVDKSSEYQGDHCLDLIKQVKEIIKAEEIELVCIEDYFFSQKFANGCNANAAYRTALHILCRQLNLHYEILNVSLWKKFVAGRSTPTKEQKKKWGKEPAKKLHMQEALWLRRGIRFPNYSLSLKTGKPVKFRYDIVDVVAQGIFYVEIFLRAKTVSCSVAVPPDHVFKKPPKTMFVYE